MPQSAERKRQVYAESEKHRKSILAKNAEYRRRRRRKIVELLGNQCACCGEKEYRFLTIDHINGLPEDHKEPKNRNGRKSGITKYMLREMKADLNKFKNDYQILCANCHMATKDGLPCPHKE